MKQLKKLASILPGLGLPIILPYLIVPPSVFALVYWIVSINPDLLLYLSGFLMLSGGILFIICVFAKAVHTLGFRSWVFFAFPPMWLQQVIKFSPLAAIVCVWVYIWMTI